MTIAEIFVSLGFKIVGADQMKEVMKSVDKTEASSRKLLIRVAALTAGFYAMVSSSMKAAVGLRNFNLTTGLSTEELQRWQQVALANGVAADTLTNAIMALQDTRSEFLQGNGESMGIWSMLGVDPRQDPFKVVESLRARIKSGFDVGLMRNLLGKVGMEGIMPVLRSPDKEFEVWNKTFLLTKQETDQLVKLNAEWQRLKLSLEKVKTQLSAIITPGLRGVTAGVQVLSQWLSQFNHWLEGSSRFAAILRGALQLLVPLLLAVAASKAFVFAASPFGTWIAPLTRLLGIFGLLALAINDIWVSLSGGKAVTRDIGEWLANLTLVRLTIEQIIEGFDRIVGAAKWLAATSVRGYGTNTPKITGSNFGNSLGNTFGGKTTTQHFDVKIQVDGSKDPKAVGNEVGRVFKREYRNALNSGPQDDY